MSQHKIGVGIIGVGMVGEPRRRWFQEVQGYERGRNLFLYDTDPKKGYFDDVNKADDIFVSVPTPPNPDGSCNISIVESAVSTVRDNKVVIINSTVPPGTTQLLQIKNPNKRLLFNPEFLTESRSWEDFIHPSRQLVGHTHKSKQDSTLVLNLLPRGHFQSPHQLDYWSFAITATEAEVVKLASNVFGVCKVVFGNMFADYCSVLSANFDVNVDYGNVRTALGADQRINSSWLDINYGSYRGFGGFCFPKDLKAHIQSLKFHIAKLKHSSLRELLEKGVVIFEAVWSYNEALLTLQNLTIEDVSRHEKEIILAKRKEIEN